MKAPICCGKDAVWINMGPKLEYWYCRECKKEVSPEIKVSLQSSDDADLMKEFEDAWHSLQFPKRTPPDSFLTTGFPPLAKRGDDVDADISFELTEDEDQDAPTTDDFSTYEGAD